jgi:CIC family chloride channel protein
MLSPQPNLNLPSPPLSARFWAVIVATGIGAGLAGALLMRMLYAVERLAWNGGPEESDFLAMVQRASAERRVALLLMAGVLAGLGRKALMLRRAKGHGGDLSQAIWKGSGRMPLLQTLGSGLLSILVVALGASLGREGAVKQTGAALGSRLGEWFRLTVRQRRVVLACGAGAGIAAAYNVPFAGALFASEVLLGTLAIPQVVPALVAALLGTAFSWVLLPNRPAYSVDVVASPFAQIVWAAVTGPIIGMAAAGYIRVIGWSDRKRVEGPWIILGPILTLGALGGVSIVFPQLLGNGKELVERAYADRLSFGLLAVLPVLKMAATAGCVRSGIPGGLFTPTMTCGALLGGMLGSLASPFFPTIHPAACAILGAGAFLASAAGGPVSGILLMIELTRHVQPLLVPLMLAVALSSLTTRALERRSIYTARFHPLTPEVEARVFSKRKIEGTPAEERAAARRARHPGDA